MQGLEDWLWDSVNWTALSALFTMIYALTFLVALGYAIARVKESQKMRNAELYVKLFEMSQGVSDWRLLRLVENLRGHGYEHMLANYTGEEVQLVWNICLFFNCLGHLLRNRHMDREVLLEWVAPVALRTREALDEVIVDMREGCPQIFRHFDYLCAQSREYDTRCPFPKWEFPGGRAKSEAGKKTCRQMISLNWVAIRNSRPGHQFATQLPHCQPVQFRDFRVGLEVGSVF